MNPIIFIAFTNNFQKNEHTSAFVKNAENAENIGTGKLMIIAGKKRDHRVSCKNINSFTFVPSFILRCSHGSTLFLKDASFLHCFHLWAFALIIIVDDVHVLQACLIQIMLNV